MGRDEGRGEGGREMELNDDGSLTAEDEEASDDRGATSYATTYPFASATGINSSALSARFSGVTLINSN